MKSKSIVLLVVAMGCGLVAMLGVQQALKGNGGGETQMISVLVTTTNIPSGLPLNDTNTVFKDFPAESVPQGAVTSVEEYEERALKTEAVAGEIIMLAKLGEKGVIGASADIPKGMRVVTVAVNETTTHSGQMAPGDRVDVIVTYDSRDPQSREMRTRSQTILEYVKIFAVGVNRDGLGETAEFAAKNVSVLVSPQQAQLVMLAGNKGKLHLAMRSKLDDDDAKAMPIDEGIFDDLDQVLDQDEMIAENETIKDAETADDIRALLIDQQIEAPTTPVSAPAVAAAPPEPPKPTWEVTIFSGKAKVIETFEISEGEEPQRVEKSSDQTTSLPTNEQAPVDAVLDEMTKDSNDPSKQWGDWLQKQFLNKNLL